MATPSGQSSEYYSSHGPTFLRFVAFLQFPTRCSVGSVKYSVHHTFMVVHTSPGPSEEHRTISARDSTTTTMEQLKGKTLTVVTVLCADWWNIYQVFPFQNISVRTGCYVKHLARSVVGGNARSSVRRDIKIRSVSTLTKPRAQAVRAGFNDLEFIKSSSQLFLLQYVGQISDDLAKFSNQCLILILLPIIQYILFPD